MRERGERKRERDRDRERERERERKKERTGYEPFALHAPVGGLYRGM